MKMPGVARRAERNIPEACRIASRSRITTPWKCGSAPAVKNRTERTNRATLDGSVKNAKKGIWRTAKTVKAIIGTAVFAKKHTRRAHRATTVGGVHGATVAT